MTAVDVVRHPMAEAAWDYHRLGWPVVPLPYGQKADPPIGFTGYAGRNATGEEISRWVNTAADGRGNIGLRMPAGVVGIDIDVYHRGGETLAKLEAEFGALPETVASTSRDDGSCIRLYLVPVGTMLQSNPTKDGTGGIELIQPHHRYMVAAPSMHPEGREYGWFDTADGEWRDYPPPPGELPELPWPWINGLTVIHKNTGSANAASTEDVAAFIEAHDETLFPPALKGIASRLAERRQQGSCRHDTLVEMACWAMREAAAGLFPAIDGIDLLRRWWEDVMDDPKRRDFGPAIMYAIGQAEADPERVVEIRSKHMTGAQHNEELRELLGMSQAQWDAVIRAATCFTAGRPQEQSLPARQPRLSEAFWTSRPILEWIRQAAYSRNRSAELVLHVVLSRVSSCLPVTLELPPIVGSPGSLNFYTAPIGASGTGKSTGVTIGRELVPAPAGLDIADDRPLGSGEGLAELYMGTVEEERDGGKKAKVRRQVRYHAWVTVDEGQALVDSMARNGSTVLESLRRAWSGSVLGQSNASQDRNRVIPAGLYRLGLVVAFQPEKAERLLDDAAGGTPQRFLWCSASDPDVPDVAPDWPGPLPWEPPTPAQMVHIEHMSRNYRRHWLEVDAAIASEIRAADLAGVRGESSVAELDSHALLHRLKVAGLLAILDGRIDVNLDDWSLAGEVWAASCDVRSGVIDMIRNQHARDEEQRLTAHSRRAEVAEAARLSAPDKMARIAKRLGTYVHDHGDAEAGTARRDLLHRLASTERNLLDGALEHACSLGWLVEQAGRYRAGDSRPT